MAFGRLHALRHLPFNFSLRIYDVKRRWVSVISSVLHFPLFDFMMVHSTMDAVPCVAVDRPREAGRLGFTAGRR
jgi:hypothetical protein